MRTLTSRAAALTIVATLSLAGCGSSDSDGGPDSDSGGSATSSESSFDAEPADGDVIKGTDYSYSVPDGWEVPENKPAGFDFDSLAVDSDDKDGFADNINVLRQDPAPSGITAEQIEKELGPQLEQQGAKDVETQKSVTVDGEPATHISSSQELNGNKNLTEQYYVLRDGAFYVITFSHSTDLSEADRDEVAGSILTTWKWAS